MPINYLFIFILSFSFSSKIYGQMVDIEPSTCEDGIALAEENFNKRNYKLIAYGLILNTDIVFEEYFQAYLKNKYSICYEDIGCTINGYEDCYNKKMLFLLREKYGESFFKDSKEEAIKQFDSLIGVGEIEMLPSMVDTLPFPFGGYDSIRKYLEGLKISTVDRVMVSFDVDKIGNISNVVVRGKLNDSSRELIKNAFLKMPRWKPAIYHGNPRGFRVTVPISSRE